MAEGAADLAAIGIGHRKAQEGHGCEDDEGADRRKARIDEQPVLREPQPRAGEQQREDAEANGEAGRRPGPGDRAHQQQACRHEGDEFEA